MSWTMDDAYGEYPKIEEEFEAALDAPTPTRGPDYLYDLVRHLPPGTRTVDVGCGTGTHARRLSTDHGFTVTAVDPVPPEDRTGLNYKQGTVEEIPAEDNSVDLIWCRDVMVHVADLNRAYAEIRRVLTPTGTAMIYQMFATTLLEPAEAATLWSALGITPTSTNRQTVERAFTTQHLTATHSESLSSEWGEHNPTNPARKLLHAARLTRQKPYWTTLYGETNYAIKLADCHWHAYAMLGKLTRHVYLLHPTP